MHSFRTLGLALGAVVSLMLVLPLRASVYLPILLHTEKDLAPVSIHMQVGSASTLTTGGGGLDGCFDLAADELRDGLWFAIATCQFSEHQYGQKVGFLTESDNALRFDELDVEDTYFSDREVKVRVISSLIAVPTDGGWRILTTLLNKNKRENGSIFESFLSEADVTLDTYRFEFGTESDSIPVGKMEFVRGAADPEADGYFVLFVSGGRGSNEVFDHSSGWHQVLVPTDTPTQINTHLMITGRTGEGALEYLLDPWGVNSSWVEAWNSVNRDAAVPGINPFTNEPWWLVWPGTYKQRSDKPDIFQGGVIYTDVEGQYLYLACHSASVRRWHPDLEEKETLPEVDCQTADKLAAAPLSTGAVNLAFQGTGDFAPGWSWYLIENFGENEFTAISSLNMTIHKAPVTLTIQFVEE